MDPGARVKRSTRGAGRQCADHGDAVGGDAGVEHAVEKGESEVREAVAVVGLDEGGESGGRDVVVWVGNIVEELEGGREVEEGVGM